MHSGFLRFLLVFAFCVSLPAWGQSAEPQNVPQSGGDFSTNTHPTEKQKVPAGVILVKGAWASASDSVTPLPEGGDVVNNVFSDQYFGMSYALPPGWTEKYKGPPPSDTGRYVLAQITPAAAYKGSARGSILITAQDMFFTPLPAANALELINYTRNNLQADYRVELKPTETRIAGHSFTFFAYWSPVAELHWYVVATQIRCHTVEIMLTSQDTKLLQSLILDMEKMKLPEEAGPTAGTGGGAAPVCIKDYAREQNVIERVDPVFTEHKFNPVPVRIIVDKKGKVKHIHFLSAFPDQAKAISDALAQWKFRPYLRGGQPVEVETGIMFGRAPQPAISQAGEQATE
ncbi:MAG TPA: hypothetical protein VFA71_07290 [Terriglobales bacterium]|nr:hypothetical protein [Terriglobales bacterium]